MQQFRHDDSGVLTARMTRDAEYRYRHDAAGRLVRLTRPPTDESPVIRQSQEQTGSLTWLIISGISG